MLSRRIIPCLDVTAGRVVKGVKFQELRDAGDPVECAAAYDAQGADELVFLDITASSDGRGSCTTSSPRRPSAASCRSRSGGPALHGRHRGDAPGRRRQGLPQHVGDRRSRADPRGLGPLRLAVHRPRDRRQARARAGAPLAGLHPRGPQSDGLDAVEWAGRASSWAPARSSSPAWTATAPRPATTSSSPGGSATLGAPGARDRERGRGPPASSFCLGASWSIETWGGASAALAASLFHVVLREVLSSNFHSADSHSVAGQATPPSRATASPENARLLGARPARGRDQIRGPAEDFADS
jgi:hypothetical protein